METCRMYSCPRKVHFSDEVYEELRNISETYFPSFLVLALYISAIIKCRNNV